MAIEAIVVAANPITSAALFFAAALAEIGEIGRASCRERV
jgi:hypothetical protein